MNKEVNETKMLVIRLEPVDGIPGNVVPMFLADVEYRGLKGRKVKSVEVIELDPKTIAAGMGKNLAEDGMGKNLAEDGMGKNLAEDGMGKNLAEDE